MDGPSLHTIDGIRRIAGALALAFSLGLASSASAASVSGTVASVGRGSFTIETPGRAVGVIAALTAAADRVTRGDYPYVYGGGHAQAGTASVGIRGPGYNGHRRGYDCSGSVAAVLAGAGLWPAGGGVPNDAGIISEMLGAGLIARHAGTGPVAVTLYDDPGIHIFMNIDGRFFGTSDGGGGGNRRGGAGWLDDGAPDASSRVYHRYHLLASVLGQSTTAGHDVTFEPSRNLAGPLEDGEKVRVTYRQTNTGVLVATVLAYPGASTTSGAITGISGSSFTVQPANGTAVTIAVGGLSDLLAGVAIGDTVQVTYAKSGGVLVARSLTVIGSPADGATAGATGSPGSNDGQGAGGWNGGGYEGGGGWNGGG